METYTPSGMDQAEADPAAALVFLRLRMGIDFSAPYNAPADRRRELAVLAVDLGRRLMDVLRQLGREAELDMVVLSRLSAQARSDEDMAAAAPEAGSRVPVLHARASELDRALKLLAVAYKQAWWSDAVPAAETAGP